MILEDGQPGYHKEAVLDPDDFDGVQSPAGNHVDRIGDSVEESLHVDLRNPLSGPVDTPDHFPCEPAEASSDRGSQAGRRGHSERQGCTHKLRHGPRPHRLFLLGGVRSF